MTDRPAMVGNKMAKGDARPAPKKPSLRRRDTRARSREPVGPLFDPDQSQSLSELRQLGTLLIE